jgi:hypothetical protein
MTVQYLWLLNLSRSLDDGGDVLLRDAHIGRCANTSRIMTAFVE